MESIKTDNLWNRKRGLAAASAAITDLQGRLTSLGDLGIGYPEADAVNSLRHKIDAGLNAVVDELDARKQRKKHYSAALIPRQNELRSAIVRIQREIKSGASDVAERRKSVMDAGVTEVEAKRLFPDPDVDAGLTEIKMLESEQVAWDRFILSGAEEDKPVDADAHLARLGGVPPKIDRTPLGRRVPLQGWTG